MRKGFWLCLSAAVFFVLLPGAAGAKTAAAPKCGATITTSITLHANLNCSAGGTNGLNVGKNGIVINLNGHSITGAYSPDAHVGIFNNGFQKITIKNGTIKKFYNGYTSLNAVGEQVTRVHFVGIGNNGLDIESGSGGSYSYDTVTKAQIGIYTNSGSGGKFSHNTLTGNGYGAFEGYSLGNTWTANNFSHSTTDGYFDGYGSTVLTGNISSYNSSGLGFHLYCNGLGTAVVTKNTANYNGTHGIFSHCPALNGKHSNFSGNTASHNTGIGIYSYQEAQATFIGNTANSNTAQGFYFASPDGCVIKMNTSNGNSADGVYFQTGNSFFPSQVATNSSSSNGGYGYNADYPVVGSGDSGSTNTFGLFFNVSG